jgi:hypothetical protein
MTSVDTSTITTTNSDSERYPLLSKRITRSNNSFSSLNRKTSFSSHGHGNHGYHDQSSDARKVLSSK